MNKRRLLVFAVFCVGLLAWPPKGARAGEDDVLGRTLLQAVREADVYRVRQLLMEGAGPSLPVAEGEATPLVEAVLRENPTLVELLLFWGADPNATVSLPVPRGPQGRGGFTALHVAAHRALSPLMALLLKNGASVKAKDSLGRTPLHWAAEAGHLNPKSPKKEVVSLLLEHGADLDLKDLTGLSAPALAREVAGEPPPAPEIKTHPAPALIKKPALSSPVKPAPPPLAKKPLAPPPVTAKKPVVKPAPVAPAPKPVTPAPLVKPAAAKPTTKPIAPVAAKPAAKPAPAAPRWVRLTRSAVRLRSAPTTQGGDTGQRVSKPARLKLLAVVPGKHAPKEVWYQVIDPTGKAAFIRSDMAERLDTPAASPVTQSPAAPRPQAAANPARAQPAAEELPQPLPAFSDSVLIPFSYSMALPPPRPVGARPMATLKNRPLRPRAQPAPGAPVVWGSKLPQGQGVRALRVHREKNQPAAFWVEVLSPHRGNVFLPEAAFVELPWFVSAQDPRTNEDKLFLLAARRGKLALAKKWFQAGANPDAAEPGAAWETPYAGWTALHWAAEKDHRELAAWLLSLGAHTNTPDAEGRLPLTIARWRGHHQLAELLKP